jgi:hypothetical protein
MANTNDTRTVPQQLADIAERTAVTAAEAVGAVLLTKGSVSFSTGEIAALGAIAGGLAAARAIVANWVTGKRGPQEWLDDLFCRAIFTFAQTLVAALIVSAPPHGLDLSSIKAASLAGVAAALAAIKGALAQGVMSDPVFTPAALLPAPAALRAGGGIGTAQQSADAGSVVPITGGAPTVPTEPTPVSEPAPEPVR